MGLYSSYSDPDLEAEIAELKAKIIAAAKDDNASVRSVAGEGRRIEFAPTTKASGLKDLLRQAEIELAIRNGNQGNAIGVNF
jgi:hypothetical protein